MGTIRDARRVLAEAETSLRQLIESGLKEQRYADVAEIAGLAEGISRLMNGQPVSTTKASTTEPRQDAAIKRTGAKSSKSRYPRFERDGDKLIKIGWSKKSKGPYEHRAPHEAIVAFARHLAGSVPEGKMFVVEKLLPVPDVANGGEIPAYQVYLTLAWFRHAGIIDKKGRDGYVLRRGALGNGALDKLWESVAVRKG